MEKNGYVKFDSYVGSTTLGSGIIPANENYPLLIQSSNVQIDDEGHSLYDLIESGEFGGDGKVSCFNIETSPSTTVMDMINAIQNEGGDPSEWNVINLTGYLTATLGLQMSNYGGTIYNIQGINLVNMNVINSTSNWSVYTISELVTMFHSVLPSYDYGNNGQFLSVVDGNATWVTLPVAEDVVIKIAEEITLNGR